FSARVAEADRGADRFNRTDRLRPLLRELLLLLEGGSVGPGEGGSTAAAHQGGPYLDRHPHRFRAALGRKERGACSEVRQVRACGRDEPRTYENTTRGRQARRTRSEEHTSELQSR